jgi:hypothetical protein
MDDVAIELVVARSSTTGIFVGLIQPQHRFSLHIVKDIVKKYAARPVPPHDDSRW